jgi:hypothetical protein
MTSMPRMKYPHYHSRRISADTRLSAHCATDYQCLAGATKSGAAVADPLKDSAIILDGSVRLRGDLSSVSYKLPILPGLPNSGRLGGHRIAEVEPLPEHHAGLLALDPKDIRTGSLEN